MPMASSILITALTFYFFPDLDIFYLLDRNPIAPDLSTVVKWLGLAVAVHWIFALYKFARSLYLLVSGQGALDEQLPEMGLWGISLSSILTIALLCYNFSAIWSCLCSASTILAPAIAAILIAVATWFFMAEAPLKTVQAQIMKLPGRVGKFTGRIHRTLRTLRPTILSIQIKMLRLVGLPTEEDSLYEIRPRFKYQEIVGHSRIRLLEISRTYPGQPIRYQLLEYALSSAPPYEAISYTWGNQSQTGNITIDGCRLGVTANALEVLRGQASIWKSKLIWIDSVCINQEDDEERGIQVQLMRQIYERATRVIVWLGESPYAWGALVYVLILHSKLNFYKLGDAERKSILGIGTKSVFWPALFDLLNHPYWSRVWIIQEIAVARTVHIYYGGAILTWDLFSSVMRDIRMQSVGSLFVLSSLEQIPQALPFRGSDRVLSISATRSAVEMKFSTPLFDLLNLAAKSQAKDERDKVFALLGIADAAAKAAIQINYKATVQHVYISTARHFLSQNDPFALLHHAGIGYKRATPNLPSWAPDWSSPVESHWLWSALGHSLYHASKKSKMQLQLSPHSDLLTLTGRCIDALDELGPVYSGQEDDDSGLYSKAKGGALALLETRAMAKIDSAELYKNGQSRFEAFWRTLIGDRVGRTRPAPASCGESYLAAERILRGFPLLESWGDKGHGLAFAEIYPELQQISPQEAAARIKHDDAKSRLFNRALGNCFLGRKYARSLTGYMAMVPPLAEAGDLICILYGGQTPFILRQRDVKCPDGIDRKIYQLVGECYVHGAMDGEEVAGPDRASQIFVLQ